MAEQKNLEWYEYAEAEQQLSVLSTKMRQAQHDLETYDLSPFSRNAILNEMERHKMYMDDIKELMEAPVDVPVDTQPIDMNQILGVDND